MIREGAFTGLKLVLEMGVLGLMFQELGLLFQELGLQEAEGADDLVEVGVERGLDKANVNLDLNVVELEVRDFHAS